MPKILVLKWRENETKKGDSCSNLILGFSQDLIKSMMAKNEKLHTFFSLAEQKREEFL